MTAGIVDPSFYFFDYIDVGFVREVLLAAFDDPNIVIDNGFGTIARGDKFAALLLPDPSGAGEPCRSLRNLRRLAASQTDHRRSPCALLSSPLPTPR